MKKFIRHEGNI